MKRLADDETDQAPIIKWNFELHLANKTKTAKRDKREMGPHSRII